MNYNPITAAIIGLCIAFSSTIVVLKLISEKNDIQSLYGKIAVAILIFQDLVAVVALALVTTTTAGGGAPFSTELINLVAKIVLLFVIAILMSKLVLPKVWRWLANSRDLLFLASLSWCFLFAIVAHWFGFSFAIGAFLAGLSLAAIPYNLDIVGQVRPLRDFFIVLFFVLIGFNISPTGAVDWQLVAVLLSLTLIAKPFIILISLSAQHFKLRTSFFAAGSLGQLSEFSVILAMAATASGLVSSTVVSSIVVATAISLGLSSYFITAADTLFGWFKPLLKPLEPTQMNHQSLESTPELFNHVVVFGYHRMGWHILKMLRKLKKEVLIVDFNPEVIERLRNKGVAAVF
ncbi:MAG: cation:proton antiporter, partial [bacterium]|nr:cation:proton antiporter [bacterium]